MGTTIRPVISEKNQYYIEKHRYYELKHFCLQYPIWRKAYLGLDSMSKSSYGLLAVSKTTGHSDPTAKCVEAMSFFYERMSIIEKSAIDTDNILAPFILKAVTENKSYEHLKTKINIPCCKESFYKLYRKFFWLLHKARK